MMLRSIVVALAVSLVLAETTTIPVMSICDRNPADGVSLTIGAVTKRPEPLWGQDNPWEPRIDNGYPNILYDPDNTEGNGIWQCFYGTCSSVHSCSKQLLLFANSSDGITWTKPNLGMYKPLPASNIVMEGGGLGIIRDTHEQNSSRRFKCFGQGCAGEGGSCCGLEGTAVSSDGFHWTDRTHLAFPSPQRYDCHNQVLYSPEKKAYFATTRNGFSGPVGRTIGMLESNTDDFSFDTTDAPVTIEEGNKTYQLYSQTTWEWHNVFLGIVMVYDATSTEQRVHCRLSWSDSSDVMSNSTWQWVDEGGVAGKDFIPLGSDNGAVNSRLHAHPSVAPSSDFERVIDTAAGRLVGNDFDSHICFAAAHPTLGPDGDVRLYYMGGDGPHNGLRNSSLGLATLRKDGFAGMSGTGEFTTRNVTVTGADLFVSADVMQGGSVAVGVVGHGSLSVDDAVPITADATDKTVAFKGGATLKGLVGTEVTLQIRLTKATIYTVGFSA
jgi:hypothetical protein